MLKTFLAIAALGLAIGVAVPAHAALLERHALAEGQMSCKQAAKLRYPGDRSMQQSYKKACKQAWKESQKAAKTAAAAPTYAGDI
jgi:hypothetical protein